MAISVNFLWTLIHSSTSFSVTLVIWTFCMVTLSWEGIIKVPTVGLCSTFSSGSFSERMELDSRSTFINPASSRY